jgi:catechol 2,3-dioxygenase-like lactoylglutathione lyase family enzyme
MPFKFSNCIALQVSDLDRAVGFYHRVLGLDVTFHEKDSAELHAGAYRLFFDQGTRLGPVMEFLVPDVEKAKEELLEVGCEAVRWEGAGGSCYMRDPFGFVFNLYEDPAAFRK